MKTFENLSSGGVVMKIISRNEAIIQRLTYYFTGKPCKYGHVDQRYVTGGCATCHREHTKKSYDKNSKKKNKETGEWREANRESARKIQRAYYSRNSLKIRAEQTLIRARRLLRVPKWSETEIIEEFYSNCPEGMQVDHIIPLQGELVSGLHVIANLQYLTESENKSKRNRINLESLS